MKVDKNLEIVTGLNPIDAIIKKRPNDVPKDEAKWREVKDKIKYFSEKPGKGD